MTKLAEAIVVIVRASCRPIAVGFLAGELERAGAIEKYDLRWEIDSRQEKAWWDVIMTGLKETFRSGLVGAIYRRERVPGCFGDGIGSVYCAVR